MHRGDEVLTFSWRSAPGAHLLLSPSSGRPRASTFCGAVATAAPAVRVPVAVAAPTPAARTAWPAVAAAPPSGALPPVAPVAPDATDTPPVASAARSAPAAGAAPVG